MKITKENYGIYVIDLMDNALSENDKRELLQFFEANPTLRSDCDGIETLLLKPQAVVYPLKHRLKKEEATTALFEQTAVAYIENELSPTERTRLEQVAENNNEVKKALALFRLTKMVADTTITFPNKALLYKKAGIIPLYTRIMQSAVVAAMLFIAFLLFKPETQPANESLPLLSAVTQTQEQETIKNTTEPTFIDPETLIEKGAATPQKTIQKTPARAKKQPVTAVETTDVLIAQVDDMPRLTPKKPTTKKYVLVIKPTMQGIEPSENYQKTPLQKLTDAGESLLARSTPSEMVGKGLLSLLKSATNERINYETADGRVSKINVNSEMLAFSVPVKNKQ